MPKILGGQIIGSGLYGTLQASPPRCFVQCANKRASGLKGLIRLLCRVPKGGCIQVPLQANKWYVCVVLTFVWKV